MDIQVFVFFQVEQRVEVQVYQVDLPYYWRLRLVAGEVCIFMVCQSSVVWVVSSALHFRCHRLPSSPAGTNQHRNHTYPPLWANNSGRAVSVSHHSRRISITQAGQLMFTTNRTISHLYCLFSTYWHRAVLCIIFCSQVFLINQCSPIIRCVASQTEIEL